MNDNLEENVERDLPELNDEQSEFDVPSVAESVTGVVEEPAERTSEVAAEAPAEVRLSDYVPKKRKGFCYFWYLVIKRIFDFFSALIVSILILLPMLIVALIVVIKDFGSPIYKQKRVGKKGKPLKVWKFRSMKKGADNLQKMLTPEQYAEYLKEYKLDDDPRLIGYKKEGDGANGKCFGAKIRRASIDELPQILFNICILGNMSVVGPRPMLESELDKYYTPEQKEALLTAKPGLTGYWQAYARNNATYESGERQKMELYYIEHRSVWLDIKIIFKTFFGVLKRDGAK